MNTVFRSSTGNIGKGGVARTPTGAAAGVGGVNCFWLIDSSREPGSPTESVIRSGVKTPA